MTVMFTCGRRAFGQDNLDRWTDDKLCSYCGSMHPDVVMKGIENGRLSLGPTDKSYKVYINEAVTVEALAAAETQARSHGIGAMLLQDKGEAAFLQYWAHEKKMVSGKHVGKFYFQHLSDAQQKHFIHLHNTGKLSIGFPGRFYVTPFFCRLLDH